MTENFTFYRDLFSVYYNSLFKEGIKGRLINTYKYFLFSFCPHNIILVHCVMYENVLKVMQIL